ncbi:NAD(P)/FAD-dependent oxidoreductase [Phreatobacter stygius]|uniref:Pyridine nucleotide-disulfide oxidoreductase n=1 Tax=Phreatobacter stygius TaxID=1940610 RepID=A0A4D7BCU9_9HYPH|nr:FAD-dependent oxidoreductase [Phreatobacter stygius]QCI67828.1 pyridine nucleotide-disulfide oxidoreductase [Phreatobacter stygius]
MSSGIVIVGGGQAGLQTAISLREEGYDGQLTLIGAEQSVPYQRPPLSKAFLLGAVDETGLQLRPQAFLEKLGIDFVQGAEVVAIDRAGHAVRLADGTRHGYGHLVIATGARNRPLTVAGAERGEVAHLRSIEDARALQKKLADSADIVVIGAGFIGLELAAVAAKLGRRVHVVEAGPRLMARAVSRDCAAFFQSRHESWGTDFSFQAEVAAIEHDADGVTGVRLADGRVLKADLVVAGIGVLPNVELAAEAGLAVDNGILVDEHLVTSDPDISAIGDCAAHPNSFSGGLIRLESVQNAADQARTVAARLAGRPASYQAVPWFWSDQGDSKLQMAGLTAGHDHSVLQGEVADGRFSIFCFKDGRFLGVESVNKPADNMLARRVLAASRALTLADFEACGFDLKTLAGATGREGRSRA